MADPGHEGTIVANDLTTSDVMWIAANYASQGSVYVQTTARRVIVIDAQRYERFLVYVEDLEDRVVILELKVDPDQSVSAHARGVREARSLTG